MHLQRTIKHHDALLDQRLRNATNGRLCVKTYKALTFAFRAVGIAIIGAAIFAPTVQPSPTAYLVLAAIILGPDVVEAYLTRDQ